MHEILAVLLTAALHPLAWALDLRVAYILTAAAGWIGYVAWRLRATPGTARRWGIGSAGLEPAWRAASAFGVLALLLLAAAGAWQGRLHLHWHMLPLLALYPVWGVVQQFLVQSLVVGNLRATRLGASDVRVTLIAAGLFGIVHAPDWLLVAATTALGLVFTPIWLRTRNVWPLGLWHGWLGVAAYFWLLDRDPWLELLGA